ncbi:MAG: hypothetical protein Q7S79_02945 [bacterium]|nr:hypothetical protein [bacterium]
MVAQAETSRKLDFQEAEARLYQIWHQYELFAQTPDQAAARARAVEQVEGSLSEYARRYMREPVAVELQGGRQMAPRSQEIRWRAVMDARGQREEQRRLRAESERRNRASVGKRRAIRRKKAAERGKDPDSIH